MSDRQYVGSIRDTRTVNGLVLVEAEYSSALSIASHPHDEAICCLVLEGGMTESWGRRQIECDAGQATYLPPNEPHGQKYHADGSRAFFVHFDPAWSDRMRKLGLVQPTHPIDLRGSRADWIASQLYREFRSDDAAAALAIEGHALMMISEIARSSMQRSVRPPWLERAADLLHAKLQEPVSMADIAAEVEVHPTHLAQTFRERYGCTMGDYLRRIRVEEARAQLELTRKPLAAIALDAGFSDQSHFTRVFKRLTGQTPGAWRRAR
jgi:AraC family transcriptional regulator